MSRVLRRTARRAAFALALAGLTMSAIAPAEAGDLAPSVYGAPPIYDAAPVIAPLNGGAVYERGPAPCRIVLERRIDPYGREIVHRLRVCDEGLAYPLVNEAMVPPPVYYPPPHYAPAPSGYYGGPRPPAPIGQRYYY